MKTRMFGAVFPESAHCRIRRMLPSEFKLMTALFSLVPVMELRERVQPSSVTVAPSVMTPSPIHSAEISLEKSVMERPAPHPGLHEVPKAAHN